MLENIKKLATSKPVLLGGAGLAAVAAYLYFSSGSDAESSDGSGGYLDNAYPGASMVFGGGYPSSDTASNVTGVSAADQALIDLQKYAIDAEASKYQTEYDIAVLDNNTRLKELELSYGAADAAVTSRNYDIFTGTFDKFLKKGTGKKKLDTFTASVGGDVFSIDVDYEKKKKKKKDKDKTPKKKPTAGKLFSGGKAKGGSTKAANTIAKLFSSAQGSKPQPKYSSAAAAAKAGVVVRPAIGYPTNPSKSSSGGNKRK